MESVIVAAATSALTLVGVLVANSRSQAMLEAKSDIERGEAGTSTSILTHNINYLKSLIQAD